MRRQHNITRFISMTAAIALVCIFICFALSACFLQEMTDSCTGRLTPAPVQTPQTTGTDEPVEETETPPAETPDAETPTPGAETTAPTPEQTSEPNPSPTQSADGSVSIGTESEPARFTMPTDLYGLDAGAAEVWFADAVFVGDSITLGWKNYNNLMLEKNESFFGQTHFLCEGSYGSGHALEPISDTSMHPMYGGEQHYVWDAVKLMGAKKVFVLFGMNDLSIHGVDGAADNFEQVIERINETNPGVQIFVISAMYMYKGSEREILNNRNLYLYNQNLVQICERKGCEFVNIASHLIDENGFLTDEYSSDHYVHQTYKAYAVWADILRSLAARHLNGMPPITFTLPQ